MIKSVRIQQNYRFDLLIKTKQKKTLPSLPNVKYATSINVVAVQCTLYNVQLHVVLFLRLFFYPFCVKGPFAFN